MTSSAVTIPRFLLPGGISASTLRFAGKLAPRTAIGPGLVRTTAPLIWHGSVTSSSYWRRSLSSSSSLLAASKSSSKSDSGKRVLAKPDKFRPPSHPQRKVLRQRLDGRVADPTEPHNYPGPPLSAKEKEEQKTRRYPNMFPPEGTVMHNFLTSRWIHIWISMGVLVSLATFTFTTNFKQTSPFAHLLPPWSDLLTSPISTISRALAVYRMHVQHNSMLTREKRHQRIEDAEKRRRYRIAHGLEAPDDEGLALTTATEDGQLDDQSPKAADVPEIDPAAKQAIAAAGDEYVDFEGRRKPVKKWLGIW